jgi:hypothetical protein
VAHRPCVAADVSAARAVTAGRAALTRGQPDSIPRQESAGPLAEAGRNRIVDAAYAPVQTIRASLAKLQSGSNRWTW